MVAKFATIYFCLEANMENQKKVISANKKNRILTELSRYIFMILGFCKSYVKCEKNIPFIKKQLTIEKRKKLC